MSCGVEQELKTNRRTIDKIKFKYNGNLFIS